jgi:hypothetical protein
MLDSVLDLCPLFSISINIMLMLAFSSFCMMQGFRWNLLVIDAIYTDGGLLEQMQIKEHARNKQSTLNLVSKSGAPEE